MYVCVYINLASLCVCACVRVFVCLSVSVCVSADICLSVLSPPCPPCHSKAKQIEREREREREFVCV